MARSDGPPAAVEEFPARLTYVGRPGTDAVVRVRRHDRRRRMARALRALGACWGLAVVSVLVPVLHFVLVPAFLLAGPFLMVQRMGERWTVLGARGDCPGCDAPQSFDIGLPPSPRMAVRCEACRRQVYLEPGPQVFARD